MGACLRAATELREHGTFTFADEAPSMHEINSFFDP
jgi:hypothetical protein